MPDYLSKDCQDMLTCVLNNDPVKRYTVADIRNHPWYNLVKPNEMQGIIKGKERIPVLEKYL